MNSTLGIGGAPAFFLNSQIASRVAVSHLPSLLDAGKLLAFRSLSLFLSSSLYTVVHQGGKEEQGEVRHREVAADGLKSLLHCLYREDKHTSPARVARTAPGQKFSRFTDFTPKRVLFIALQHNP